VIDDVDIDFEVDAIVVIADGNVGPDFDVIVDDAGVVFKTRAGIDLYLYICD
jgi:hypothetical protein